MKLYIKNITLIALLIFCACDIITPSNQNTAIDGSGKKEQNNNEQPQNSEEYFGVCRMELFDFHDEMGYVQIVIDLVMEDYVHRSQLDDVEWEEQRKSIIKLQNKFRQILEENGLIFLYFNMGSDPWLATAVDEQALLFICKHEMVETVFRDRADFIQSAK
ncbi:MAG: hypothetical protein WD267_08135 [Balneolales bacterium]